MKKLLATIGVHPTVIELDDHEIAALPSDDSDSDSPPPRNPAAPSVFIGGTCIGGLESLVALHLSGQLVTKLVQVGALWVWHSPPTPQYNTHLIPVPINNDNNNNLSI